MDERAVDLLVAGGGAAGTAYALWQRSAAPGLRVLVAEADTDAGGWIRTERRDGYVCERGPQGFRPTADSDRFVAMLGLDASVVPASAAAKRRWVVRGEHLCELPSGPGGLLTTKVMSFGAKLRALTEPWRRTRGAGDESIAGFVERRLGKGAVPLAEAMAHGIFGGEADRLELGSVFPAAAAMEREHGSLVRGAMARAKQARASRGGPRVRRPALCSFAGGMQELVANVRDRLGDALATGTPVVSLRRDGDAFVAELGGARPGRVRARRVELALPAAAAAALVEPLDADLAALLRKIPTASVASTYVGAPRAAFDGDLDGFGFLFPGPRHANGGPVLGTIFCSSTFPMHAPDGHALLRVMSGGAAHPGEVDRDDPALVDQAIAILRHFVGLRGDPTFTRVLRARAGIHQYERGHAVLREAIGERLRQQPGLGLRGAAYRQVSVVGQWSEAGSTP